MGGLFDFSLSQINLDLILDLTIDYLLHQMSLFLYLVQGVKIETIGRQNERNSGYVRLAHTSMFGLCFMTVCSLPNEIKLLLFNIFFCDLVNQYKYLHCSFTLLVR